ncbi:helix-turn-helix transcriptional regulator [Acinetobacter oleivorans]|uniref:AraC family transcriptional regulator n=1 Tax=Acinetobacter TaxID=469 RepID=UPI000DCF97B4|nr:helix-turn-helix transcriptional regulator [Acinetobacter oleivorans]MDV7644942.1 helix-turn-helix transcriptional regulator [Acinetobacter baumannii]
MSHSPSLIKAIEESGSFIIGVSEKWEPNTKISMHTHSRHQLIYSIKGSIQVLTDQGYWILPPLRAIWIDKNIAHGFRSRYSAEIYILYIKSEIDFQLSNNSCVVLNITPLLKELVNKCITFEWYYPTDSAENRLSQVLIDQLVNMDQPPVNIPEPQNLKLKKIVQIFRDDPSNTMKLSDLSDIVHASERTIERLFIQDTGMSFSEWRNRFRLVTSLEYLAENVTVSNIANLVGYDHSSSYISAFKKMFGCTPKQYFSSVES